MFPPSTDHLTLPTPTILKYVRSVTWLLSFLSNVRKCMGAVDMAEPGGPIFGLFASLPMELRLQIWDEFMCAESTGRPLIVHSQSQSSIDARVLAFPELITPLLSVNRESRTVAQCFYPDRVAVYRLPRLIDPQAKDLLSGRDLWDLCHSQVSYVLAYTRRAARPAGVVHLNTERSVLVCSHNQHWTASPLAMTLWREATCNRNGLLLVLKRLVFLRTLSRLSVPPYNDTSLETRYVTAPLPNITAKTKVRIPSTAHWAAVRQSGMSVPRSLESILHEEEFNYADFLPFVRLED
ncbi:hypothetical protein BX600DRAFT_543958 [Xylariales sp. PMI_506]|nr:hypothetical protein BX600DRAFT_543958 [Xylariales sp. PMI_506]